MHSTSGATPVRLALVSVLLVWTGVSALTIDPRGRTGADKPVRDARHLLEPLSGESAFRAAPQPARHAGELTEPITSVIKHPKSFLKRFEDHGWSGHVVPRECVGCAATEFTTVSIGAIEDAHQVDFKKLPTHGVIMARLENTGPRTERKYGIPPHAVWYLLWGGEPTSAKPVARFVKVVHKFGITSLQLDTLLLPIDSCAHRDTAAYVRRPDADFKTCDLRAFSSPKSGAWISCSQGCCTAGGDTTVTPLRRR